MIYSSPGPDPGYNPTAPMVGIVEPGFLPGFTWSQSGVFKEAAGRCIAATVYCIAGVIIWCYYQTYYGYKKEVHPLETLYGGSRLLV